MFRKILIAFRETELKTIVLLKPVPLHATVVANLQNDSLRNILLDSLCHICTALTFRHWHSLNWNWFKRFEKLFDKLTISAGLWRSNASFLIYCVEGKLTD